ncbi:hypothetical protein FI667_g1097, partial [Globisporangium splendens]
MVVRCHRAGEEQRHDAAQVQAVGDKVREQTEDQAERDLVGREVPQRRKHLALQQERTEQRDPGAHEQRADKHTTCVGRHHKQFVRTEVDIGLPLEQRLVERDRDGVVQHALTEHEVEEKRWRVELVETRERRDRVHRTDERAKQERLDPGELRDDAKLARVEQHAARDARRDDRAEHGGAHDRREVAEERLALDGEAALVDDGRQQHVEEERVVEVQMLAQRRLLAGREQQQPDAEPEHEREAALRDHHARVPVEHERGHDAHEEHHEHEHRIVHAAL